MKEEKIDNDDEKDDNALWSKKNKDPDESTGPLAHLFDISLSSLICSLACSLTLLLDICGKVND